MDRKKELKQMYKDMKPDMGVFAILSKINDICYLEDTQNLKGRMNGVRFRLNSGNFVNKKLQTDWNTYGEDSFTIQVLENIEYDKDEMKTDYSEELDILKMIWKEKLSKRGFEFY